MAKKKTGPKRKFTFRKEWVKAKKKRSNSIEKREYTKPQYRAFRQKVKNRDGKKCRWPRCNRTKRIQVHHIKKWADHPALRYIVSNGICLCRRHHDSIKGKEENYEIMFFKILQKDLMDSIKDLIEEHQSNGTLPLKKEKSDEQSDV